MNAFCLLWCEELTLELCPNILDTTCITGKRYKVKDAITGKTNHEDSFPCSKEHANSPHHETE
jgi:hypothetical protein